MPQDADPILSRAALRSMAAGILVIGAWAGSAQAAESVYTDLDLDACTVLETHEEGAGVELECAGHDGIPVYVSDGDARMDVDFGAPNDLFETFGPFNTIGDKVEWRLDENGVPFAAIIRFHLDSGVTGGPEDRAQVLVVSSIGQPGAPGCVVAAIDAATEQANGVARGAAAFAARHECGTDAPVVIGGDDPKVFSMGGAVPEGQ